MQLTLGFGSHDDGNHDSGSSLGNGQLLPTVLADVDREHTLTDVLWGGRPAKILNLLITVKSNDSAWMTMVHSPSSMAKNGTSLRVTKFCQLRRLWHTRRRVTYQSETWVLPLSPLLMVVQT
jgi:hypothetical protein